MNQFAAIGMLARVYLNAEVYTGTPQWDKVLELTHEIIAPASIQLDADVPRAVLAHEQHCRRRSSLRCRTTR